MGIIDLSDKNSGKSFSSAITNSNIGKAKMLANFFTDELDNRKRIHIITNISTTNNRMFCFHIVGYCYRDNMSINDIVSGYINNGKIKSYNSTNKRIIPIIEKDKLVIKLNFRPYYTFFNISSILADSHSNNIEIDNIVVKRKRRFGR